VVFFHVLSTNTFKNGDYSGVAHNNEDTAADGGKRIVHWDESGMSTCSPDVFNVVANPSEVELLYGNKQTWNPGKNEVTVTGGRILLNPPNALRLAEALSEVIRQYESRYGVIQDASSAARTKEASCPQAPGTEGEKQKADFLFQLVKRLNAESGFERSFKIVNGALLNNRWLLGINKSAIRNADDRLMQTCSLMGMPKNLLDIFRHHLAQANYVHFGLEQDEKATIYKVYLEFFGTIKREIEGSRQRPGPALLHLGLKWDVSDLARQSLTRYTWHPWLSSDEIVQRVSSILESGQAEAARAAAERLVSVALARIPARDILYLEVTEDGNPRRSFDINVYRANLQVTELYTLLSMLSRRHSIPFDTFHSLYHGIKTQRFGHLAAGVDRKGNSFFTTYYGVEDIFRENPRRVQPGDESKTVTSKYSLPARRERIIRVEETDDKARRLFHLVKGLGVRAAFERSFKFFDRTVLTGRFLYGFKREASAAGQDDAILNLCRLIDMPEDFRETFQAELPEANIVLFGFEKNEKNCVYKAYLEFNERMKQAVKQEPMPESVVIHAGFKWDAADNARKVTAQYRAFHILPAEDIAARILRGFYQTADQKPYRIVDDMLDLAGSRTRPGELLYFEASEENNLRRSFDINLYRADLRMAEMYPLLLDIARHYCIEMELFEELYEGIRTCKFGHVSGGTDREGRDFLTVYFSEKGSSGGH
jgi:hypothetical protein